MTAILCTALGVVAGYVGTWASILLYLKWTEK